MKNIELFNVFAAEIFKTLHDNIPSPVDLIPSEVIDASFPPGERGLESHEVAAMVPTVYHTCTWLRDEGFIKYAEADTSGKVYGARLTEKGLMLLGMPRVLSEEQGTFADEVTEGAVDVSKAVTTNLVTTGILRFAALLASG